MDRWTEGAACAQAPLGKGVAGRGRGGGLAGPGRPAPRASPGAPPGAPGGPRPPGRAGRSWSRARRGRAVRGAAAPPWRRHRAAFPRRGRGRSAVLQGGRLDGCAREQLGRPRRQPAPGMSKKKPGEHGEKGGLEGKGAHPLGPGERVHPRQRGSFNARASEAAQGAGGPCVVGVQVAQAAPLASAR